jgi:dipeptidase D
VQFDLAREVPRDGWVGLQVSVAGLQGGHSGMQIHERLLNAIKALTSIVRPLLADPLGPRLASFDGGTAHNAIPRVATATLVASSDAIADLTASVQTLAQDLRTQWAGAEPGLTVDVGAADAPAAVIAVTDAERLVGLLDDLPHGVLAMSDVFPDCIETSLNLARVQTAAQADVLTSMRSLSADALADLQSRITTIATGYGASVEAKNGYPAWEPRAGSTMAAVTEAEYAVVYGKPPRLDVIHGGLECGVIAAKRPGLDAISFGPLIKNAHTPDEHVYAATVASTWALLVRLLDRLAGDAR